MACDVLDRCANSAIVAAMVRAARISIPKMRSKLALLYAHGKTIRKDVQLAKRLNVANATLSEWISGVRSGIPDSVPAHALDTLATILVEEAARELTTKQAADLWKRSLDLFNSALIPAPTLGSVLKDCNRRLALRHVVYDEKALGMHVGAVTVPDDIATIAAHCGVAFEFASSIGKAVLILCEQTGGWRVVTPSRNFPRIKIAEDPQRFPKGKPWFLRFEKPLGLHRFVVIEHSEKMPLLLPESDQLSAMPESALSSLATTLNEYSSWRWGEAFFDVR